MRKLFRRIFNLDKAEKVAMLEKMVELKTDWIKSLTEQRDDLKLKVDELIKENNDLQKRKWTVVKNLKKGNVYYVVTQGGYYPIKANTFLFGIVSEVTRRAIKNGFVVNTREEAEALQKAMRDLVK